MAPESAGMRAEANGAEYLARARALAPMIAGAADDIEKQRRLPEPLVEALIEGRFFRMLLPRPFGGAEIDPLSFVQVIETVAKSDASTAWILCQTSVAAMVAALLPAEAAREIWSNPRAVIAWGPGQNARAVAVEGGYRVTGTFAFASGCWYATWLGGDCAVHEADGTPRRRHDGAPVMRRMLFPASEAVMKDIWHVIGLKGTGSDSYTVADLFVPQAFSVGRIDDATDRRYRGPLYELSPYSMFACGFAALALGLGRAILEALVRLAVEKTPRGYKTTLQQDDIFQSDLAQAEAQLRAARALLFESLSEAWDAARRGGVSLDQRMGMRLAATYAIRQAKTVTDTAYGAAGTTAVFAASPFERRFRDMNTVVQQLQGRKSHYRTVGRHLLGLDSDLGWV